MFSVQLCKNSTIELSYFISHVTDFQHISANGSVFSSVTEKKENEWICTRLTAGSHTNRTNHLSKVFIKHNTLWFMYASQWQ